MRADVFLVAGGYVQSRQRAKKLIELGSVWIDEVQVTKASLEVPNESSHTVRITDTEKYVSRGGYKLEAALNAFAVKPQGWDCLDIGASTGGFTDCLLQHGARHVTAVDAGVGQLAERLQQDARVTSLEHYNARELSFQTIGERVSLVVIDVSFISQTYILPCIPAVLAPHGIYIGLVKPQFEAGRQAIGKGGIVREKRYRLAAVRRVYEHGISLGLTPIGLIPSPITGGDGNHEYLICFRNDTEVPALTLEQMCQVINQEEN